MKCDDCGSHMGRHGCTWCHEESYILDQYTEQDMHLPSQEFQDIVKEQKEQERRRREGVSDE